MLIDSALSSSQNFHQFEVAIANTCRVCLPCLSGLPFLLETSRLGVFAAGDVRLGSMKRVASAVGEGSMAVQLIHQYLQGM